MKGLHKFKLPTTNYRLLISNFADIVWDYLGGILKENHSSFETKAIDILKEAGLRVTKSRLALIKFLSVSDHDIEPTAIFKWMKSEGYDLNITTIYRMLTAFEDVGLVHQTSKGTFLTCIHPHSHSSEFHLITQCESCQSVDEAKVPDAILSPLEYFLTQLEFNKNSGVIRITGNCKSCS